MINPHIIRKTTDPVSAPPEEGIHWINTASGIEFFSIGVTSLADWVPRIIGAESPASSVTNETTYGISPNVGTSLHYARQDHTHGTLSTPTKTTVGLSNVDNTSDVNKPISTSQQNALNLKADLASPTFTGTVSGITSVMVGSPSGSGTSTGSNTGDQDLSGLVVKNSTITGATKTKITYDSKGLVTAGADLILNDASDVILTNPMVSDILQYNGVDWVNNQLIIPVSAGAGVNYYLTSVNSGVSGYDFMRTVPDVGTEVTRNVVVNNNTVNFANFISDSSGLGGVHIDAGIWTFNISAYVSTTTGVSNISIRVFSRTSGGIETLLFTEDTSDINSTTVSLYNITTIQPAFTINPTDHLVFKFDGVTSSTSNKTISLVHSGSINYSFVSTPFLTRHNDLVGIQGGTTTERYHLTAAQATVVQNTSGVNTGDQPIITSIVNASNAVQTVVNTSPAIVNSMSISPIAGTHVINFNTQYSSVAMSVTAQAAADLTTTINTLNALTPTNTSHPSAFGNETLFAGVYTIAGAATITTLTTLTLDAQGNANAIFVFRMGGAFSTGAGSTISLINGANPNNVFFVANGAVSMGATTIFKGNVIAVGSAVDLATGCNLTGRFASTLGALTLASSTVTKPTIASVISMGAFARFAIFTSSGAVTNTGSSTVTGDIGTNSGAITGFGTSTVNGSFYTSAAISSIITLGIYISGVLSTYSDRVFIKNDSVLADHLSLYSIITTTIGQTVDIRVLVDSGSITVGNRILTSMRIG